MARRLSNDPCRVTFADKISGGTITFPYRMPATEERAGYENELWTKDEKTGEVKDCVRATRRKYGLKILTGITEGDFEDAAGNPISSDPASEHYREDWADQVKEFASDLLELLAIHVYEPNVRGVANTDPFPGTSKRSRAGCARRKRK